MTAAGPWSVKGIDPKAREIAKDLARRSGMTLGDWLNQMIIDGGEPEAAAPPALEPRRPLDDLYREAQASRRGGPSLLRAGEDADANRLARAVETLATRVESTEQRSVLAISGMDQSVMGVLSRLDEIEREQGGGVRLEASVEDIRAAQSRIAERLRKLESEDGPRAEGLKALEAALGRMAMRLDEEAERSAEARAQVQQAAEAAHAAALGAAEAAHAAALDAAETLAHRLDKVETVVGAAPAAYADAEKVETVLTRMAERLDETQTRTTAAVQSLQTSFAGLDARLRSSEARGAGHASAEMERRFQALALDLQQRVEASRADLAQRLRAAADGRVEKMETALRELGGHVEQAEKRSAQAIDRIGREVLRVAHSLGDRVAAAELKVSETAEQTGERLSAVESRSTAAVESMGGEVARLADAMESRLRHADDAQAEALEKLGGEIARIAERLAERIANSDRRSAEAIDEVTDKVVRIGAHIDERQAASASELSERIRASEARTAKLLDDARERLDQRLADVRRAPESPPAITAPEPVEAPAPAPAPLSNADPFGPLPAMSAVEPQAEPALAEPALATSALATSTLAALEDDPFAKRDAFEVGESPFDPDDDFTPAAWTSPAAAKREPAAGAAFEPVFAPAPFDDPPAPAATTAATESAPFLGFSVNDFAPPPEPAARPEQVSTREMLDAARQAARRAASGGRPEAGPPGSVPAPPLEPIGSAQAPRPFGITFPGRRKKEAAPTLRTVILASITAGAITTMGVGAYLLGGSSHEGKGTPELAAMEPPPTAAPLEPPTSPAPATSTPNLAVAVAPPLASAPAARAPEPKHLVTPATPAPVSSAQAPAATPGKASGRALFANAVSRLDSGDLTGLPDLQKAADQGVPSAQFYLARLYEAGGAGLKKDLGSARQWTAKAAQNGDSAAMYNLASYMYAGDGGSKDVSGAASWFRKAAEHGVVNGQYNLAQLYEKGYGVPQSDAEAYKWYLVAAGAGDTEARSAADSLKARMAGAAQTSAERGAAQVRAQLPAPRPDGVKTAAAQP